MVMTMGCCLTSHISLLNEFGIKRPEPKTGSKQTWQTVQPPPVNDCGEVSLGYLKGLVAWAARCKQEAHLFANIWPEWFVRYIIVAMYTYIHLHMPPGLVLIIILFCS